MVFNFFTKLFGTNNDRILKSLNPIIEQINALEPRMQALSDEQIVQTTMEFKQRVEKGETLDEILPEAFALVREASVQVVFN